MYSGRRATCLVVAFLGCALVGGCRSRAVWIGGHGAAPHDLGTPFDASRSGGTDRSNARSGATRVVHLAFDVVWIQLPVGRDRDSLKVWNHVDELRVDAEAAVRLRRNGFRIGAAVEGAWPAFQAIVEAADATVREDRLYPQRGFPLVITSGQIEGGESVFSYDASGRLSSKTFPAGDKLIVIDYVLRPELGGTTDVRVGFEIRRDLGVMTWAHIGDEIRQVPDYDRHVFADLTTTLALNPGDFMLIGASEEAGNRFLLGGRFLMADAGVETLLCVRPRPYQTDGLAGD